MKVKDLPPIVGVHVEICKGTPLDAYDDIDFFEAGNSVSFAFSEIDMHAKTKAAKAMQADIVGKYGNREVLAIEPDFDGTAMLRIYVR